jgi:solute carrier family 41
MLTLLLITLPVEVVFLGILDGLEWLKLPILFVGFAIVFFCCAVRLSFFFPCPRSPLSASAFFSLLHS